MKTAMLFIISRFNQLSCEGIFFMRFLLEKNDGTKSLKFNSYFVLKDEAEKIINKSVWTVTVFLTSNEAYANSNMFPAHRKEEQLPNGQFVFKFSLVEVT